MPLPPRTGFVPKAPGDEVTGRAAPSCVECVGVQKMFLQSLGTSCVEIGGFIDQDPGVLPRDRPGLQRGQCQRQAGGQLVGLGQQSARALFGDCQNARDLRNHGHFLGRVVPRGHGRCRHVAGRAGVAGGEVDFQSSQFRLRAGDLRQPVQTCTGPPAQRIGVAGVSFGPAANPAERGHGRGDSLEGVPTLRAPSSSAFHTQSMAVGSDIVDQSTCLCA